MQNILAETSQLAEPSSDGRFKSRVSRGSARGKCAREGSGDAIPGEEIVTRPITRFEVDRHLTKMKERESELIRDMYQVPDYVEF